MTTNNHHLSLHSTLKGRKCNNTSNDIKKSINDYEEALHMLFEKHNVSKHPSSVFNQEINN